MKTKKLFLCLGVLLIVFAAAITAILLPNSKWKWGRNDSSLHDTPTISYAEDELNISLDSPQVFVYCVSTDTVLLSKGEDKVVYPGSTTKLLTILYALTLLEPDEIISPGNELELVKEGSSVAYIKSHHKLSVEMLVEGMLLPSGNDAAYVLAAASGRKISLEPELDGREAVNVFMNGMKEYAEKIGLCGTSFTTPDGYADEEHYTTTEDMIIVSKLAFENDIIMKYASMPTAEVVYASGHTNTWTNTNKLLDKSSEFYSEYAIGLKTGSIDDEYSLVFAFRFVDGREYIAGVFGHNRKNTRYQDALKIIEELE